MRFFMLVLVAALIAGCSGESIKQTRDREKKSAQLHTELAGMYYQRNQMAIALSEIDVALKANPSYAPAYNMGGLIHMALHEDREAEEGFLQSLRIDSMYSEAHNNYGWFLCQRGRVQESIAQFEDAVKNPLYATPELAYLNAGLCSQKEGKNQEAMNFLQQALHARPGMLQALFAMSQLKFTMQDFQGAQKYFARFASDLGTENMTAEQLWLGIRIARSVGDRNSEASYTLSLRGRYPDSPEAQQLSHGE